MTRDEIVTALRCCDGGEYDECNKCPLRDGINCRNLLDLAAADLIENQQRHIEALMKANDSLKDAIARRDKQIEDMKQGMAQLAKAVAVKEESDGQTDISGLRSENAKLATDRKELINELCQYCGKYKQAYEGACDGCKWRDM